MPSGSGAYQSERTGAMTVTDDLLANNDRYAEGFAGPLPLPPSKHVAVVACMDARLNVYGILGLHDGEAHVIRNAGGVITDDEIRSLTISQRLLGTQEIILIHHTDCGMLTFTDDDFKASIQAGHRHQARMGGGGLPRPGRGRPPVDQPDQGQPVHPAQGLGPRLRLRRGHRQAQRGGLAGPHRWLPRRGGSRVRSPRSRPGPAAPPGTARTGRRSHRRRAAAPTRPPASRARLPRRTRRTAAPGPARLP